MFFCSGDVESVSAALFYRNPHILSNKLLAIVPIKNHK